MGIGALNLFGHGVMVRMGWWVLGFCGRMNPAVHKLLWFGGGDAVKEHHDGEGEGEAEEEA